MKWLLNSEGDVLVVGQPGAGKTELLQSYAQAKDARFLLSENPDIAAAALLAGAPAIVMIDDAGLRRDLINRLRHLRLEQALGFRIIAVCWPFEKDEVRQTLQITEQSVLNLEGLSRPVIAQIIEDVAAFRHVKVSDQFIRVVAKQARGKPGLAAALSLATIESSGEALVSGELLLRDLAPFLHRAIGNEGVHLLAAFACGGRAGASIANVAKHVDKSVIDISIHAQRIALAGVLEQTGKETLCVEPSFLRSALIKAAFFPNDAVGLPWEVAKALIENVDDPVLGYLELIGARNLAGAAIDNELLRGLAKELDDLRFWEALASLDERNCDWVVRTKGAISADMKRSALRFNPKEIIPAMLQAAALEKRPLNIIPNADLRILQEWVAAGAGDEAITRRRVLFDAAIALMRTNTSVPTALEALRSVFNLDHHESDSDPADPRTIRFRHSLLGLNSARQILEMWQPFLEAAKALPVFPWPGIPSLVENWMRTNTRGGSELPAEYSDFLRSSSQDMITQLIPLASGHHAALRWLQITSGKLGINDAPIAVSADFMTLYPEERLEGDWRKRSERQDAAAIELANRWQGRPFREIVETIVEWERQADELGRVYPRKTSIICERLAELIELGEEDLTLAIASLPSVALQPFIQAALSSDRLTSAHLNACLERPDLTGILIAFTLTGRTSTLYAALEPRLPPWIGLVEGLCIRNEVPEEILEKLLNHTDAHVRLETALYMFRSKPKGAIPESVAKLWYKTIVHELAHSSDSDPGAGPYDLMELLASHPSMRYEILDQLLSDSNQLHGVLAGEMLHLLVTGLEKEQRRKLLHRCKHLIYSPLPALLVGTDEDLYRELLGISELTDFHLSPLQGDPNDANWIVLARLALAKGHSHAELAHAVEPSSYSWTGGLSGYFQEWVERFERLSQSNDPDVKKIAEAALLSFTERRDREKKRERLEEIHGFD